MDRLSALLKTALFTIFVPCMVAGYVPWQLKAGATIATIGIERVAAIAVLILGALIYLHTAFWGFAFIGGGTPAPISPTRTLVVRGLHGYVRNPMYIGVGLAIAGQAWLFHSIPVAIYLACVFAAAHLFVLFYEEPTLQKQFGDEYLAYKTRVPRWIPRIRL